MRVSRQVLLSSCHQAAERTLSGRAAACLFNPNTQWPSPATNPGPPMSLATCASKVCGTSSRRASTMMCRHTTLIDVSGYPDVIEVQSFGKRTKCAKCGARGQRIDVRPNWKEWWNAGQLGRTRRLEKVTDMPRWRVDILRKKAEHLRIVTAPNAQEARNRTASLFRIDPSRYNKLMITKIKERERERD